MCIVESTTYVYSDGQSLTKQRLRACPESRNGESCKFETYKDLGERYVREVRSQPYSPESPSLPSASARRPSLKHGREKRPQSYVARTADIFFGSGREKKEKHYKKRYYKDHDDDSHKPYEDMADGFSGPSRRYSHSGGGLNTAAFTNPATPPFASHAGASNMASAPKIHSPLSPPRSPGSPSIQQSGTAVYHHPSSTPSPSRFQPSDRVTSSVQAGDCSRVTEKRAERPFKKKTVIINNSRNKVDQDDRHGERASKANPKGGKYVMSGARNFTQPGPSAPSTPPITPERPDNEFQARVAARERSRAEQKAYYRELEEERNLDLHEERAQARHKFREEQRQKKKAERQQQEELERAQNSRASSVSYDYEEGERERKEMEGLSEKERRRRKREGKRPVHRASPAASDPFPIGHPPPEEPRARGPSRHKHTQSAPINHARSDDLAATKEQMARERAAAEAREYQEAIEDAAYEQARARELYEGGMGARYHPPPTTPAPLPPSPRHRDTSAQSPPFKLDHVSSTRRLRRPSAVDTFYSRTHDPLAAAYPPSRVPASAGASIPTNTPCRQPFGSPFTRPAHDPHEAYYGSSLHPAAAHGGGGGGYQQSPYQQHVMSHQDALRERGTRVVAAAAAEESRARNSYGGQAGLMSGFSSLRLGEGPAYAVSNGANGAYGGAGAGLQRRGTISGDGHGWYQREQRGWRY